MERMISKFLIKVIREMNIFEKFYSCNLKINNESAFSITGKLDLTTDNIS
jgi:hypothetical protein